MFVVFQVGNIAGQNSSQLRDGCSTRMTKIVAHLCETYIFECKNRFVDLSHCPVVMCDGFGDAGCKVRYDLSLAAMGT